jgi:type VI secretion system protein ImpL
MDAAISQFTLDVDGQLVKYSHGPQIPTAVQWPGPRGSTQVRVQLQPALATGSSGLVTEGPWALFRLFDRLNMAPAGAPERFRVVFDVDGRKATFEVTASSVVNPFQLRELREFACPASL